MKYYPKSKQTFFMRWNNFVECVKKAIRINK